VACAGARQEMLAAPGAPSLLAARAPWQRRLRRRGAEMSEAVTLPWRHRHGDRRCVFIGAAGGRSARREVSGGGGMTGAGMVALRACEAGCGAGGYGARGTTMPRTTPTVASTRRQGGAAAWDKVCGAV
jgi:hypothetical protein